MLEKFEKNGYEIVALDEIADIYIINTCTVTNMSDRKSRQMLQKAKKQNQNAIIVVTGCLAQVGKEELMQIPEIDLILGNEEKKDIVVYIEKYMKEQKREYVSDIMKQESYISEETNNFFEKTRAIVKVQDGCNNYCSYCIIPYARGKCRSKKFEDVMNEIINIVKNGYKEIVLTGIHICSYGKDLGNITFIELLERINEIEGLEQIRLSSLEPNVINEEFVFRLKKLDKVCPHFHLSLQSCCNKTLRNMNRKYKVEDIYRIVKLLKDNYSNVNITADIIVGFPGETDEDFEITKKVLEDIKINKIHVFQYSNRKGTVASKMENQINPNVKHVRSNYIIKLSDKNEQENLLKYINTEMNVLIEKKDEIGYKGFTKNYLHAIVNGQCNINEIVKVKVIEIENNCLICKKI